MDRKIKTKEYMFKKLVKSNRLRNNVHNIKTKEIEEIQQGELSPFSFYAPEKVKDASEKALIEVKKQAFQGIKVIRNKKVMPKVNGGEPKSVRRILTKAGISIKTNTKAHNIKLTEIFYQQSAQSVPISVAQKRQFLKYKNSNKAAEKINKFLIKFTQTIKKIMPPEWQVYGALIAGGVILIIVLMVVVFGGIFGGDGTTFYGAFAMPFDNADSVAITDGYGWRIHPVTGEETFHYGIDFGTPHHCQIKAAAIGLVVFVGDNDTYGNSVILKHEIYGDVMYSMYAHLSQIDVTVGQMVMQGEVVGLEGGDADDPNPGTSTGHHLHFAMMNEQMEYVNPSDYLAIGN